MSLIKKKNDSQEHVYINARIDNIYSGNETPKRASIYQKYSSILSVQSDYEMAVTFWNLKGELPIFICPILEGFVNYGTITAITNAATGVFTTASTAGLYPGLPVNITGVVGMTQVNGNYQILSVLSPITFTLSYLGTSTPVDTSTYSVYVSGGTLKKAQDDIDLTPYGVSFSYGGNDYPAPVMYNSFTTVYPTPVPYPKSPAQNGGVQDLQSNAYYTVYAYQDFLDMVNLAIATAFNDMAVANPGLPNVQAPQFQFDPSTKLISFVCEYSFSQPGTSTFHMNDLLLNYFAGFQVTFNGYNASNFKDYTFIIEDKPYNKNAYYPPGVAVPGPTTTPPVAPLPPYFLKITQDYNALYLWSNIRSIIFSSSTILSRDEIMPPVLNPNAFSANQININKFNPASQNILSYYDIIENEGQSATARQYIYYNPTVYKYIDLVGDNPLETINIDVYIQLTNGQLLPVYIPANQCIDIKLLFRKKLI